MICQRASRNQTCNIETQTPGPNGTGTVPALADKGGPHETGMGRPGKDLRKLARSLADSRKAYYLRDSARDCTFRDSARAWQTPGRSLADSRKPGRLPEGITYLNLFINPI